MVIDAKIFKNKFTMFLNSNIGTHPNNDGKYLKQIYFF